MSKHPHDYFSQEEFKNLLNISATQSGVRKSHRITDTPPSSNKKLILKYSAQRLKELSQPKKLNSSSSTEEVGPATYDVKDEFLSNKLRVPAISISKTSRNLRPIKDNSPSAFSYSPRAEQIYPTAPTSSFGQAKVSRLEIFNEFFERSPGPKYLYALPKSPTVKFNPNKTPSPVR